MRRVGPEIVFQQPARGHRSPARAGRERSAKFSKRFGRFRQSLGVHEKADDARHSRVDFHSWRRWFITQARNAGIDHAVVAAVVGHTAQDITDGTYRHDVADRLLRACVEAVRLPVAVAAVASAAPVTAPRGEPTLKELAGRIRVKVLDAGRKQGQVDWLLEQSGEAFDAGKVSDAQRRQGQVDRLLDQAGKLLNDASERVPAGEWEAWCTYHFRWDRSYIAALRARDKAVRLPVV